MTMKFLEGEIASQPSVVTLDSCIIVYVLIKINERHKKFYHFENIRRAANGIYLPSELFSNILVSSIGDKIRVGVSPETKITIDDSIEIHKFLNVNRCLGSAE